MPERELTNAQRALLLALMVKAGPVENRYLTRAKINLKKAPYRDQLVDWKLITLREKPEVPYLTLELTEKGWGRALEELSAEVPALAGSLGGTLYLLLDVLRQHFEKQNVSAAEFFSAYAGQTGETAGPAPRAQRVAPSDDLESRIRKAYADLAAEPGAWVTLEDVRRALGDGSKPAVDHALLRLDREPDVSLIPESNQKTLTAGQRSAAVRIGNQDMHLLAVGR
ncbi:hypothetical protein Aab01nite_51280 [Paractinoplanes abujensis]|uniref:Uncharacterized protein n=1 Tax=Paractinoplanes abujensis TaxID=882441 RepID=A0A7W7G4G5_9ACTN|nr:hypothetical protein [Actinoplanes abujensis]MBB4693806.1 hypothetical protein [Actinoplanes abujensis]GID21538.1 hypothetical protein Aab01nite_51280 [Actinoplanes abujensis]